MDSTILSDGPRSPARAASEGATVITCPVCETRYRVDETALGGPAGREVRCASCGNSWHYSPEGAALQAAVAETAATVLPVSAAAPPVNEPAQPALPPEGAPRVDGPVVLPRPSLAAEPPRERRRPFALAWLGGLVAVAAIAVLVAFASRNAIVAYWPAAAPLYSRLHLAAAPGDGLKVTVMPTRTADALIIEGSIVNGASGSRQIPHLRVSLRNGKKEVLASKVIAPPVTELPPGGSAHFGTTFAHPSGAATGVEVTFASD